MRVLHVIPSLAASEGGPSLALPVMAAALVSRGVAVDVVTTDDDGPGKRLPAEQPGWQEMPGGWRLRRFPKQTEFYKASLPMAFWLLRHVADYDLVHVHAVFSFCPGAASAAAHLRGVPCIVRPLGTLNAWGMKNRRRWVKALSFRLLDKPLLDRAAALHCTSRAEADELAPLGIRARPVVVPLGMDLAAFQKLPGVAELHELLPQTRGRRVLLFLSRLDEKKGIGLLLEAFAQIHAAMPDTLLLVAGEGPADYAAALRQRAWELRVSDAVVWSGHLSGRAKLASLAGASLFVLPSRSENFGIALLEAMACGLPCVATTGVALAEMPEARAALLRVPVDDPAALAAACLRLLSSPAESSRLGAGARQAAATFSSEVMAERLRQAYSSILSGNRNQP